MIIDGGDADFGLESTIVKTDDDGGLTLLRPGKITLEDLRTVTEDVRVADAVISQLNDTDKALSPGMKYKHYAPKSPLFLLDGTTDKCVDYLLQLCENNSIALIWYNEDVDLIKSRLPGCVIYPFGNKEDELTQAHLLFNILRDADKRGFDEIYAPLPSCEGLGLALYNRMIRAAAHHIIRM